MRKLCLDIGSKKIGIAVTDPTNTLAQPLATINRSNISEEADRVRGLMDDYEVDELIAGLPIDLKGQKGIAAQNMERYIKQLETELNKNIIRVDERMTTKIAEDVLKKSGLNKTKRQELVDALAATVILQNYLEHEKK